MGIVGDDGDVIVGHADEVVDLIVTKGVAPLQEDLAV